MFIKWKEAFQRKGLRVSLAKTKMVVSGSIAKDDLSITKVNPCGGFCSLRVKANSALCVQCGMWIYCRCAGVKIVTTEFLALGLNQTIDQWVMANSVCWYGHVFKREYGYVLRRALNLVVEG